MVFRADNISFSAMRDLSASHKNFFACFSVIYDAGCRCKLGKRRAGRADRERGVSVLKASIHDSPGEAVTPLKPGNEVELMLGFET